MFSELFIPEAHHHFLLTLTERFHTRIAPLTRTRFFDTGLVAGVAYMTSMYRRARFTVKFKSMYIIMNRAM